MKIRIIYSASAAKLAWSDWPNVGFDFQPVMDRITGTLKTQFPNVDFRADLCRNQKQAEELIQQDSAAGVDGYVVYQMNPWVRGITSFAATGKPTLYCDFQYGGSGGHLIQTAKLLREKAANVAFLASSNLEDLVAAVKCFEIVRNGGSAADFATAANRVRQQRTPAAGDLGCKPDHLKPASAAETLAKLKQSKILAIGKGFPNIASAIPSEMGIELVEMGYEELNDLYEAADKEQAQAIADRWQKTAVEIVDVTSETLFDSAKMYLAKKALLAKHKANAITINCLGGFTAKKIQAYPCLGFYELNNEGLVGGCECDIRSAATMLLMNAISNGRPGYISDPVIDTASRQIIYAHCVAPNRVFGPQGEVNPFSIFTHSEDRKGASVRSTMPLGYMTTTAEVGPERKTLLLHRAKAVANVIDDRACRTKLAAEPVGDIEKLFTEWDYWGWHRVTTYGDLREPLLAVAEALNWKVIEEA